MVPKNLLEGEFSVHAFCLNAFQHFRIVQALSKCHIGGMAKIQAANSNHSTKFT